MPTYTTTINHLRIMKNYAVSVDITMSKTIYIDAENEESAKTIANNWIADNPYYYAKSADCYVSCEVIDINENNKQ